MVHSEVMNRQAGKTTRAPDTKTADQSEEKQSVPANAGLWTLTKALVNRFNADQCGAWAAALSFFAMLSLVPLLTFGIALVGLANNDPQAATEQVQKYVANLLPGPNAAGLAAQVIKDAKIPEQAAELMKFSGVASIIGVLTFLWTSSRVFVNAIPPMNAAFGVKETRGFLMTQVYAFGMLLGAGVLFILSLLPSVGTAALRQISWFAGLPDPSPWWLQTIFVLLGIAINMLMFTVIYRFLPSPAAKVQWKQAAVGGIVVAVLWEIAKEGFALYLRNFGGENGYNKIYGSLASLMILVLWIYYTSTLLLLGAEIARLWTETQEANAAAPKDNANTATAATEEQAQQVKPIERPITRRRGKIANDEDLSGRNFGSGA